MDDRKRAGQTRFALGGHTFTPREREGPKIAAETWEGLRAAWPGPRSHQFSHSQLANLGPTKNSLETIDTIVFFPREFGPLKKE